MDLLRFSFFRNTYKIIVLFVIVLVLLFDVTVYKTLRAMLLAFGNFLKTQITMLEKYENGKTV